MEPVLEKVATREAVQRDEFIAGDCVRGVIVVGANLPSLAIGAIDFEIESRQDDRTCSWL